ncbi:DUF4365 domain-containing protein [Dongia sp.]|uniref:DUF4365 domain-containing protein n=1 Tax=Dongia sp. TaxID=1977262 RepID=UPI0035B0B9A1
MAKKRGETHLTEDKSQLLLNSLLPQEWVVRKLHPDYGVDLSIEVFERNEHGIPTMGEFLFVQLKASERVAHQRIKILERQNVEKILDTGQGKHAFSIDVISFQIDLDTIDNSRLMGPSTPLLLLLADLRDDEIYFVCLTDYYDKIIEPQSQVSSGQRFISVKIPSSNKLSDPGSLQTLRLYAARAKLYAMFNLAQFQFRESKYLLDDSGHNRETQIKEDLAILERFAKRLRSMPIWERKLPWILLDHYRVRLDGLIGGLEKCRKSPDFLSPQNRKEELEFILFIQDLRQSWEQFSAIGQTFEDIVREWFLPTFIGQLSSADPDDLFAPET